MSASVKKKTSSKSGRAGKTRSRSSRTTVKKTAGRKSASAKRRTSGRKSASSARKTSTGRTSAKGRNSAGRASSVRRTSSATRTREAEKASASATKAKGRASSSAGERAELGTVWVDILLLLVIGLSLMLLLGNIGRAGLVGNLVSNVCFGLFGAMEYAFPFLFLAGSFFYAANRFNRLIARKMTGLTLIFLFLCAIAQLFSAGFTQGQAPLAFYEASYAGHSGGGLLGGVLVLLFGTAFGMIGAELLAIIGLFIGLLLLTQKPILHSIGRRSRMAAEKRRIRRDVRREEYEREEARREMDFESLKEQVRREEAKKLGQDMIAATPADLPDNASVTSIPGADGRPELDMPSFGGRPRTEEERKYEAAAKSGAAPNDRTASVADIRTGQILPQEKKTLPKEGFGFPSFLHVRQAVSAAESALRHTDAGKEGSQTPSAGHAAKPLDSTVSADTPDEDQQQYTKDAETVSSGYRMDPVTGEILGAAETDSESRSDPAAAGQTGPEQTDGRRAASLADKARRAKTEPAGREAAAGVDGPNRKTGPEIRDIASGIAGQGRKTGSENKKTAADMADRSRKAGSAVGLVPAGNGTTEEAASGAQGNKAGTARPERVRGTLPPFDLLTPGENAGAGNTPKYYLDTEEKLVETFASFHVEVTAEGYSVGPTVTRYELKPGNGVKVSRIVNLQDDIKLALEAQDIRIEAPIPGKAAVGIEVPNKEPQTVPLRELLESKEFRTKPARLAFAVGRDIEGKPVIADIEKMPHLLIAGATGSGKSVCINTLIMSLLYKYTPEEVRLLLIDPKVVELKIYDGIPHLLIPVVTDAKKAAGALNWAVQEMTSRYNTFAKYTGVRDIKSYNKKVEELNKDSGTDEKLEKMPRIVIIVDELADLMMVASKDVEDAICRLAQLARAAGIHLVVATQRPSVNVVTGQIKANMPSRIALAVTSGVDSRTILDMNGAERLLGKGDMLYYPQGQTKPERVQGAYVSDSDIARVVDFLTAQSEEVAYNKEVEESIATSVSAMTNGASLADDGSSGRDEYFAESGRLIIKKEKASIGMLQRAFKIGFNRAARIMDQLCEAGVVGGEEGTKPRKILMTSEQFEQMLSSE